MVALRTVLAIVLAAATLVLPALAGGAPAHADVPPTPQVHISAYEVHPEVDQYDDFIYVSLSGNVPDPDPWADSDLYAERLEIVDPGGNIIVSKDSPKFWSNDLDWDGKIGPTPAPTGIYTARGYLVADDGTRSEPSTVQFWVINEVPSPTLQLSDTEIQPATDGVKDTIEISLDGNQPTLDPGDDLNLYAERVEIVDDTGTVVHSAGSDRSTHLTTAWDGRDPTGDILPAGSYTVRGYFVDRDGKSSAPATAPVQLELVTPPPTPELTLSASQLYPYVDGYKDSVTGQLSGNPATSDPDDNALLYDERLEIVAPNGDVVLTRRSHREPVDLSWSAADGGLMAAGVYEFRVSLVDSAGNASAPATAQVRVVREHVQTRRLRLLLRPNAVRSTTTVGRCSQLRRIGDATWPGALGLHSNTLCRRTAAAGTVTTTYVARIPATLSRDPLVVSMVGGADPRRHRSIAEGRARLGAKAWTGPVRLAPAMTTHSIATLPRATAPSSAQTLRWLVRVRAGSRYEVLRLNATMTYRVLVPDA